MSNSNGPRPRFPSPSTHDEDGTDKGIRGLLCGFVLVVVLFFTLIGVSYFDDGHDKTVGLIVTSVETEGGETIVTGDVVLRERNTLSYSSDRSFTSEVPVEEGKGYIVELSHWRAGPGAGYDDGVITEVVREDKSFAFDLS